MSRVLKTFRAEEELHEIWAYIEEGEGVKIVRVLHGARNLEEIEFNAQAEGH